MKDIIKYVIGGVVGAVVGGVIVYYGIAEPMYQSKINFLKAEKSQLKEKNKALSKLCLEFITQEAEENQKEFGELLKEAESQGFSWEKHYKEKDKIKKELEKE
ncbi:MAG: hypothetical protein IB618_02275 [Candidatus Pacearchaeota archaeon]|nr:MAG: hypothetical protein IB618_02275 [Candidatus Pacearchaeota archaeon]